MQIQSIIDRHQPAFAASGCQLSLQRAQQSHWVQVDVNPAMVVGQPGRCWHDAAPRDWLSRGVPRPAVHTPSQRPLQRAWLCVATLSVHVSCLFVCALLQCLQQLQGGPTPLSNRSQDTSRSQAMRGSRPTRRAEGRGGLEVVGMLTLTVAPSTSIEWMGFGSWGQSLVVVHCWSDIATVMCGVE